MRTSGRSPHPSLEDHKIMDVGIYVLKHKISDYVNSGYETAFDRRLSFRYQLDGGKLGGLHPLVIGRYAPLSQNTRI